MGHGSSTPLPAVANPVAPDRRVIATERAATLPVGPFAGRPRAVLTEHTNELIALLYDAINQSRTNAEDARVHGDRLATQMATKDSGVLAIRAIDLDLGRKVHVMAEIRSQDDIPSWLDVPLEVREQFERVLAIAEETKHWSAQALASPAEEVAERVPANDKAGEDA